jgi:uroporphyrinogen-III synthase
MIPIINQVSSPLRVLIPRPQTEAEQLQAMLAKQNIFAQAYPLFTTIASGECPKLARRLSEINPNWVVFVSAAAVSFAHACYPLQHWPTQNFVVIGLKTKRVLQPLLATSANVVCPEPQTSEGLLALTELMQIANQQVLIVRGDGGRELIAETLTARGAKVHYVTSYLRHWRTIDHLAAEQWQNQQFNCIVITSNGLLEKMIEWLTPLSEFWIHQCLWLVASARIASYAKALGLQQVVNIASASNQAMFTYIADYGKNND